MKTTIIITLAVSVLVCGGTVLIARDQIRDAKAKSLEWERKAADYKKASAISRDALASVAKTLNDIREQIPNLAETSRDVGRIEAMTESLERSRERIRAIPMPVPPDINPR